MTLLINLICIFLCVMNIGCKYLQYSNKTCLPVTERTNRKRNIFEGKDPIIIESTKRSSHQIVSYIIAILLKERLGYPISIKEMGWDDTTETIKRLTCDKKTCKDGRPQSHINMEVWMPPGFTSSEWVNDNLIIDCGPLGPSAKTGIYYYNQTKELPIDDWRKIHGLNEASYQFANHGKSFFKQLRILGNCNETTLEFCRTMFSIDPDLPPRYANLMNRTYRSWALETEFSDILTSFYFTWHPNEITVQYNLPRILFPDCNPLEPNSSFEYCDDSINQLSKVVWIDIKTKAPLIYNLVDLFHLPQENLIEFLNKVNISSVRRDAEYFEIACEWIRNYKPSWEPFTIGWNTSKYLSVLVVFPASEFNISFEEKTALELAIDKLNNNVTYFGSFQYQLKIKYKYVTCYEMLEEYLDSINMETSGDGDQIVGILSGLPTECLDEVYKITNARKKIMISFRHDIFPILLRYDNNPILKMNNQYIFQTMPSKEVYYVLLLKLLKHIGWRNPVVITDNDDYKSALNSSFIQKENTYKSTTFIEDDFEKFLQRTEIHARIFIVDWGKPDIFKILCSVGKLQMTLENGFVWIINGWLVKNQIPAPLSHCTEYIQSIIEDYFYLSPYTEPVVFCSDFYSGNSYRAMMFLGQIVSLTLRKDPSVANFNANTLMNITNKVTSDEHFCSNKLIHHDPINMNQNSLFWSTWYFYKINRTNVLALFSVVIHERQDIVDSLDENIYKLVTSWNAPKDTRTMEDCWARFLAKFLKMECIHGQMLILFLISLLILLSFIMVFVTIYCKKAHENVNPMKRAFHDFVQDLLDIDIHSSNLILNHIIGRGAFGMVYGGEARNAKGILEAVAVKTISENSDWIEKIDFFTEAKVMRKLRHPNIVELIGVCLENENNLVFLIMELMVEGDLRNYLMSRRSNAAMYPENSRESIELRNRLNNFARDTAEGLNYMHSKFMVHRDVACRNCLISHDFRVKLGDFGLTRYLTPSSINGHFKFQGNLKLPVRWMPPEGIQFGLFSIKSDIWSFGILLFEIVTFGVCPYQDFSTGRNLDLMERIRKNQLSIIDYLPQSARDSTVYELIKLCCSYYPKDRPDSMDQIISAIKSDNTCIRPYLTDDPPKFEDDKNLDNLSVDLPGIVIEEDELPFTSPTEIQLSSSQRYINMINRAFGIKSFSVREKTDFPDRILRPCQSTISISKNQLSVDCNDTFAMKKSIDLLAGSIPVDLSNNMGVPKKPRATTRSVSNIFKISLKQSNIKMKMMG